MYQYDNQFVVMSRRWRSGSPGWATAVSGIAVRVADPWTRRRRSARHSRSALGYPYRALDWQTQNSSLFSALKLEKLAMGLIIFFIMVVAAFNIVGTLTMVVTRQDPGDRHPPGDGTDVAGDRAGSSWPRARSIGLVGTLLGAGARACRSRTLVDSSRLDPDRPLGLLHRSPAGAHRVAWTSLVIVLASLAIARARDDLSLARRPPRLTPVEAIRHE